MAAPRIAAVIPARFASTRFPGKPLADRTGRPLIQHVIEQARTCPSLSRIIVATDHDGIAAAARACGAEVAMTRADHPNGTSRIAEVAEGLDAEIIVNIQGDEPQLEPELIERTTAALLADPGAPMATLVSPFAPGEDPSNPNVVKCVVGVNRRALYFSRSLVPHVRSQPGVAPWKHVGLYVYRRAFLPVFVSLPPSPLELCESLEQLRALEHGHAIAVAFGTTAFQGIDTPEQYEAFVAHWRATHG